MLYTTLRLFRENGLQATSMSMISNESGVSMGVFTTLFRGKRISSMCSKKASSNSRLRQCCRTFTTSRRFRNDSGMCGKKLSHLASIILTLFSSWIYESSKREAYAQYPVVDGRSYPTLVIEQGESRFSLDDALTI
ncbi:TetR/AcrR family transcriptional regulator [Paenibacillus sp. 843]|uniref:TetR/AcrR family transcriptional regulator n=1 Tax=Paenibacillus sp. 843 TaxID=3341795 RepID=UPI0037294477